MRLVFAVAAIGLTIIATSPLSAALRPAGGAAKAPAAAAEGEWPCWLGPNHDGKSTETGLLKEWPAEGPKLLWKVTDIGHGYSGATVSGGLVYITGDTDDQKLVIFAFDMNGAPKWKQVHDAAWTKSQPGARASCTIDGGNLYLESGNGAVGCYDAKTGAPKWKRDMKEFGGKPHGWGYAESVLIHGAGAFITPGGANCIVALDKTTGKTVWTSKGFSAPPNYSSCLPVTFEGVPLIINGTGGGIVCVDARTGAVLWSNDFSAKNTANCPTPAYSDGYVFWANGYGKGGICMKMAQAGGKVTATEAWRTADMVCHHGGYIIDNGYVYGDNGGGVSCLELPTGKVMWKDRAVGKGSLCWADGMLYLLSESGGRGALATCSPQGMQIKGKVTVQGTGPSWAHPVIAGGRLYLRYDTNFYCFDVKGK